MKKAVVRVVTVDVTCPHCDEPIEHPDTGSLNWELDGHTDAGTVYECRSCGKEFEMPKSLKVIRS